MLTHLQPMLQMTQKAVNLFAIEIDLHIYKNIYTL